MYLATRIVCFFCCEMSEENKSNSSDGADSTYNKAKEYWKAVEPTVCGMLGGLPEVGFLGKSTNLNF